MAPRVVLFSLLLILYTYLGYPLFCWARARLSPRPIARARSRPRVSVIIAAHREADTIAAKLATLAAQTWRDFELIVACDGSDDGTAAAARAAAARLLPGRVLVLELTRCGKALALDAAAATARGEVLVFTDARQRLAPDAIEFLVEDLGDPEVGAVGGALTLEGDAPASAYWRYEAWIRECEGRAGSTVGVSGALWAIRRALFEPLPPGTLLDDLLVPERLRAAGWRVAFEPAARVYDDAAPNRREFRRKIRTLSGNFQLLALAPALFHPWRPGFLQFLSHKLLRLAVPWALAAIALATAWLDPPWRGPLLFAQLSGYGLALASLLGPARPFRPAALAETFLVLNAAAAAAFGRFLRSGRRLPW